MMPTPPPGFELDQASSGNPGSGAPPPPPGFELDSHPSGGYGSDVRKNAVEGLKEIPMGAVGLADTVTKAASMTSPIEIGRSALAFGRGTPLSETPIAEDVRATVSLIKNVPKGLFQTLKDVGSASVMPAQMALGTPASETTLGKSFRERPLSTTANIATVAIPAAKLFKRGATAAEAPVGTKLVEAGPNMRPEAVTSTPKPILSSAPSALETRGGQGLYQNTGIRGVTIGKIARRGENPGAVGTNLIKELEQEGAIGGSSAETWSNVNKLQMRAGQDVKTALNSIKAEAAKYGGIEDPLVMPAEKALKPLYDEWASRAGGATSQSRTIAKQFENVYGNLVEKAKAQGGVLHIDDIRSVMDEVGPLTHVGNDIRQEAMASLYKSLADTRDAMVQNIADGAKNQSLKTNLLEANKRYSRLTRIMPDIGRASAMESVGQPNMGGLVSQIRSSILGSRAVNKSIMKAGEMLNKTGTAAPESAPTLSKEMAREFLKKAKGDKSLARKMAASEGWSF